MGRKPAPDWLTEPAERINETVRKLDAKDYFQGMVRRWHKELVDSRRRREEWEQQKTEHAVRLKQEPHLRNRDKAPAEVEQAEEYWMFIERFEYYMNDDFREISGWVPMELLNEPNAEQPLPLSEQALSMPERCAITAAIHDVVLPVDPIDPWNDSPPWWEHEDKENMPTIAYAVLKHKARELQETDKPQIKVIVDAVLDDLHKTMSRRSPVQGSPERDKDQERLPDADVGTVAPAVNESEVSRATADGPEASNSASAEAVERDRLHSLTGTLPDNIFRRWGSYWALRFKGQPDSPCPVKDSVGMVCIWHLLQQEPGKPIPSVDLKRLTDGVSPPKTASVQDAEYHEDDGQAGSQKRVADQDAAADIETLRKCHKKMARLRAERDQLTNGKGKSDPASILRVKEIQKELDSYAKYVGAATGLGGRLRELGMDVKKRPAGAIAKGLKRAYKGIRDGGLPELADWLHDSIQPGQDVTYRPSPHIEWDLF